MIKFVSIHDSSKKPERCDGNIGYTLRSVESISIPPNEQRWVNTGIGVRFGCSGMYLRLSQTTYNASRFRTIVMNNIIGQDHSDEIQVLIFNLSKKQAFKIKSGDIIATGTIELTYPEEAFYQGFTSKNNGKRQDKVKIIDNNGDNKKGRNEEKNKK